MENQKPLKNLFELAEHSRLYPGKESLEFDSLTRSEVDPCLRSLKLVENDKKILKEELNGVLKIVPRPDGLAISSNSYIGFANFDSFSVVVKPKVLMSPDSLFGMINYAFDLDMKKLPEFSPRTDENYLVDVIIFSFIEQCKILFKKGLYKSYVTHQEDITFLRGKLLLKQHIQNVLHNRPKFACEFDELEYDNLENQITLFCLKHAYKITKNEELKKEIRKLIFQISTVVSEQFITGQEFKKIQYTRQNNHYKRVLELCKLIIDSSGIVDFYSQQKHLVNAFFVDMNLIFEKFVANLFKDVFSDRYRVLEQKEKKVWSIDEKRKKGIRTDILLENLRYRMKKIVIDTKYKDDLHDSDLYQIGFYIHEYFEEGVSEAKRGYAVLPTIEDLPLERKHSTISSIKQGIQIVKSFINIDQVVPLLGSKIPEEREKLKKIVENLLLEKEI